LERPWEDKKPPAVPSLSYQTDSLLKPKSALGLATGTPLSVRARAAFMDRER